MANLSASLAARGAEVSVVTCDRLFKAPGVVLPPHEIIEGIAVHRIPWHGSPRYPMAPGVFAHLRHADLVHVHGIDFFYDALAAGWLLHRRPMIVTTHGGFFHTQKFARIKRLWFRTLTRASALAYHAVVTCSEGDQARFREILPERAVMIENGVNLGKFAGTSSLAPQRRIVTIGRFAINKRLDRLLDMMVALRAEGAPWSLDVIGTAYDQSRQDVEALIAARGLGDVVHVHIGPADGEIAKIIGGASFFASASEYEGFGLVAVEAMSAGLVPVLHANAAYLALARRHGDVVTADFGDPQLAAQAMRRAWERFSADPLPLRARMIAAAGDHSWDQVTRRYIDVYERAVPGIARRLDAGAAP